MYKFKFADIGEGLHEGKVGEVYKKEGDDVQEGDSLFLVETDKVTSEIPSPVTGKIIKVLIKKGETVHVGDDVFYFEADGEDEASTATEEKQEKPVEAESAASVVGEVKVSNELFSFGGGFDDSKEVPKAAPETYNDSIETTSVETPLNNFDISKIEPKGSGEKVDIVVVGAGPGGYSVAELVAKQGFKTVIIEKEYAGGVCLNVGCIPTKALLKSAKILEEIKEASDHGINLDIKSISVNWTQTQKRKEEVVSKLTQGIKVLMKMNKVEFVEGEAKILDKYNVQVNKRVFTTKVIILATGSSPIRLPLKGFDSQDAKKILMDSTQALSLKKIPKSLAVIGGGVIGVEFAALYHEFGTKVTILEGSPNILGTMDHDIQKFTHKMLEDKGIKIYLNAKVQGLENKSLIYELDGKKHKLKAEKVLESVGRRPNNLNLKDSIGIELGPKGEFVVNEYLQTSISNIFAIGDANAKWMLAHVAYKHSHVVASFLKGQPITWDRDKIASCVYTHPEISSIGKTEQELKEEKVEYIKSTWQNVNVGKVLADGKQTLGFTKLLVGKKYGEILGAHIINNNSSDMITEIAAILETEGTVYELAATVHPHPSIAEVIYEAAVQAVHKLDKH